VTSFQLLQFKYLGHISDNKSVEDRDVNKELNKEFVHKNKF